MANEKSLDLLFATVAHSRLIPRSHSFRYRVFYVALPVIPQVGRLPRFFGLNKRGLFSLHESDYTPKRSGLSCYQFVTAQLKAAGFALEPTDSITLITHPRMLGFAFNPISFWLVTDSNHALKAVIAEVTSTFKQRHLYFFTKPDRSAITANDCFRAPKKLYVSPFNSLQEYYELSFAYDPESFQATVNLFDESGKQKMSNYVAGTFTPASGWLLFRSFFAYPAMTILVVLRIHYQAFHVWRKKIPTTMDQIPENYVDDELTIGQLRG